MLDRLKKGQNLIIQAINANNQPLTLPLPLNDFAKAYDGPPTDPKVFEEQQKKLQEELQKRAEEARKNLEKQQGSGGAAGAGGAARSRRDQPFHETKEAPRGASFHFRRSLGQRNSVQRRIARPVRTGPILDENLRHLRVPDRLARGIRQAGSARRHRRCIRSPNSPRADDRTAGPCAAGPLPESTATTLRCC